MIKLSDLEGRSYLNRECLTFHYWLKDDDGERVQLLQFINVSGKWIVQAVLQDGNAWQELVDEVTYKKLENVCANGVVKFQKWLQDRAFHEQELAYYCDQSLKGML